MSGLIKQFIEHPKHAPCASFRALPCACLFRQPVGIVRGNTGAGLLGGGLAPFLNSGIRRAQVASPSLPCLRKTDRRGCVLAATRPQPRQMIFGEVRHVA